MKNVAGKIAVMIIASAFAASCAKPVTVREEAKAPEEKPAPKQEIKVEDVTPAPKPQVETAKVEEPKPRELTAAERLAKLKEEFRFEDIHFDFDKSDILPRDREILDSLANWLKTNQEINIRIEGHCDERGTNDYNLALGERRAYSARQYLINLGVNAARINTVSYGEETPLCNESTEECWVKNRRGHFVIR